jgi:hypothetical protein
MFAFDILEAKYVRDHVVWLRFRDGVEGETDLCDELSGEVFEPLHDADFFRRFRIEGHSMTWPNGADFAPEFLHERVAMVNAKVP